MTLPEATKDITAEWLNQALHENEFLSDAAIVSLSHEPIGIGEGFSSDMAKLKLSYDRNDSGLPETIIAKLPTSYGTLARLTRLANFYEREIRFYLEVAPTSPIRTPGLIYGAVDLENERYALLLEDCSQYTPADPELKGLSYEDAGLIISKIADFHTRWWDADDLMSFPWMPKKHVDAGGNLFRKCWDRCLTIREFLDALPPGGLEAGDRINRHYAWLVDNVPENHLTIQHWDLKSDNVFFYRDDRNNPVIIFDWAMATVDRGVGDPAFLLQTSLTKRLRKETEKDLIKQYHERLKANGISGYSFDECWTDYLKSLLIKTGIPVIAFSRVDQSDSRSQELWSLMLDRAFSAIVDNDATRVLP